MTTRAAHHQIATLVRIQSGLITRVQALHAGMSPSAISRRVQAGIWRPVLPGIYLIDSAALTTDGELLAGRLWLGPDAVVDGHWAAWLHRLIEQPRGPVTFTVSRPRAPRPRPSALVRVRRRTLSPADVTYRSGAPVTSRALTALECAALVDGEQIMDRALQRGTTVPSLRAAMARLQGARGARAARGAIRRVNGGEVSVAEREYRALLRSGGIDVLAPSVTIVACGQELTVDFASVRLRLAVEIDGWRVHSTGEAFHRDRAKQNLLEIEMWTILRFTPRQIRWEGRRVLEQTRRTIETLERRLDGGACVA